MYVSVSTLGSLKALLYFDYICQVSQTVIDRFAFYSALKVLLLHLVVRAMKCRFLKKDIEFTSCCWIEL